MWIDALGLEGWNGGAERGHPLA
uniref:Uncharacterized protein n=1 Tax=Rhizophora mucronata TaxID=61149 RepID=A0A2P2N033_RHIMU